MGLPGAKEGLQPEDPTIAEMLKPLGYVTGQFGKNHLGDLDAMLPTMHGFDEFFGSLYHLNAEEEPENPDYPKDPAFRAKYAPRGVLHTWALPDGGQKIENTGPLTKKRMEIIDEEFEAAAAKFIRQSNKDGKPFFVWFNSTRMHIWTHLQPSSEGKTGLGIYPDGMVEHDALVGRLLGLLDSLGIAEQHHRDVLHGQRRREVLLARRRRSPYRNEKASNWEGAYRVPGMIKWPGVIPPGTVLNDVVSHQDWLPTLVAAAGNPNVTEQLLNGYTAGSKTFKVHLDGYNLTDYLSGKGAGSAQGVLLLQ